MSKTVIRRSERIYDFLLRFYPQSFRQEFGDEMRFVFSESARDAYGENGGRGMISLWTRTIIDAGKSLVMQHVEDQKRGNSMKTKQTDIIMQNKVIVWIALATGLILLVPFLAMQFSDQMAWGLADFVIAGGLLFGLGLMFVFVARKAGSIAFRLGVGVALATAFLLVFGNIALGIIGSEDQPANLMYYAVLAVGIIGALIARFRPRGMARAMFAAALAQVVITLFALIAGMHQLPGSSVSELLRLNGLFAGLWVVSALLFRRAGATGSNWSGGETASYRTSDPV